jgi:two-component system, OmpR family, sensor histidine kinase KdpD
METERKTPTAHNGSFRGKLKVFLGMCAGVGKTYAMLQEARQKLSEGADVVVGFVETHGRPETQALLQGIPAIPLKRIDYRGIALFEPDLDAILARKPSLVIIDELPHTNAMGSRHTKRYQDVLELLDAGIDVVTAINVQHIESRCDVVHGITSVKVLETVPDSIIDLAEDIQLIDITPEDLRTRLAEGKVYLGERAATAADHFFRMENLSALREIAMRAMAEKVGKDVRDAMAQRNIPGPWKSSERFLVAVGPSPFSEPLIRWTRRIASATHSPWVAAYVDRLVPLSDEEKSRLARNLSLVRQLGGETVTVPAEDVASALLQVAREKNVTQIVIGKPLEPPLIRFFTGRSIVDRLILKSGDIDVCVVRAEKKNRERSRRINLLDASSPWYREIGSGAGVVAAITIVFWLLRDYTSYFSFALLYLLSIVVLALRLRRGTMVFIAVLTGALWNFLFIPPIYTFRIGKFNDVLMFCMYVIVALVIGSLTTKIRLREIGERMRQRRTGVLYQLAQCVVESRTLDEGIRLAINHIDSLFDCRTAVCLVSDDERLAGSVHPASTVQLDAKELSVVDWVYHAGKPAGRFTDTLRESPCLHIPLQTAHGRVGVLSLLLDEKVVLDVGQRELVETVADHVAALIDRYDLIRQANRLSVAEESEKLFHILFDSVSHELKTPLAVLSAATSHIKENIRKGDSAQALVAQEESAVALRRLKRSVENLLGMTRMESGQGAKEFVACDLEEVVLSARDQVADLLEGREINVSIPDQLPMIKSDPVLFAHAIANVFANAVQYSPRGSGINAVAALDKEFIVLRIVDQGEGFPPEEPTRHLFEKFRRGRNARPGGTGLGLSIVSRFMNMMGGTVNAENNAQGNGATVTLRFPIAREQAGRQP